MAGIRNFSAPLWLGKEPLKGKTILLYAEQGLGDTLQFCRYVPLVAGMGATIILEVQPALVELLKCLEGVSRIISKGDTLPVVDLQCPLLSLPLAFNTALATIPAATSYLYNDKQKVTEWQELLGSKTRPRVGVVWSSVSGFNSDAGRSMPLATFLSALPKNGVDYICLQKEIKDSDRETLEASPHISFTGNRLNDFSDTAALIDSVDLVISTCTSVPHLSCALGKPTWLVLAHVPDWRWLLDRKDSPWYPTVKLYRQDKAGQWGTVLGRIKQDLTDYLNMPDP